jgi:hypothetical protein
LPDGPWIFSRASLTGTAADAPSERMTAIELALV